MTGEADTQRMLDGITNLNEPTYSGAKYKLARDNKLNRGTQKALDSFYNKLVLKNGTKIARNSKDQIYIQMKNGQFRKQKGYERFIKKFKELEKK